MGVGCGDCGVKHMAITTVDGAIAGMQPTWFFFKNITPTLVAGRPQSLWGLGGIPGAGSFSTALNGAALVSNSGGSSLANNLNGQLPWLDPASGNSYLSRLLGGVPNGGALLLCDRLWHNGGFTAVTTAQNITSPTWPARDQNGATSGAGVFLMLEYNATGAANTPTITVSYTNSAGVSGRTGTNSFATVASPAAGASYPIGLQAGDVGVQSVQSVTFSIAPTAGSVNLVAYRVIAALDAIGSTSPASIDLVTGGMPQIYNGSVPYLVIIAANNTGGYVFGSYGVTQG